MIAAGIALAAPVGLAASSTAAAPAAMADPAAPTLAFSGTGLSYALGVSAGDPSVVPLVPGGEGGVQSPTATSAAGSTGNGKGLASMAYPGSFVATFTSPTTIGGMLPVPPDTVPSDQVPSGEPVTVASDGSEAGTEEDSGPGYLLRVESGPQKVTSQALGGIPGGFTRQTLSAVSSVEPTQDGGIKSVSSARIETAGVEGTLDLGTITTVASAIRLPDGTLKRSSEIELKGASLEGFDLGIKDGELVVTIAGTDVPVGKAIKASTALEAVRSSGLKIALQDPKKTKDGIIAPSLTVTFPADLPAIPLPAVDLPAPIVVPGLPVAVTGIGPIPPNTATVTSVYGFAQADASKITIPPPPEPVTEPQPDQGSGGAGTGAGTGGTPGTPGTPAVPGSPGGSAPVAGAPVGDAPDTETPATAVAAKNAGYRIRSPFDAVNIYLAIVAVALIAGGAGQLARYQGVKTSWKS